MVGARPGGNPKAWDPTESTDEEEEDWDEVIELPVPQAQMKSSFLPQSGGSRPSGGMPLSPIIMGIFC